MPADRREGSLPFLRDQVRLFLAEEQVEHPLVAVEKVARYPEVLGLGVSRLSDSPSRELKNPRVRIRQEDRRMRGDDELAAVINEPMEQLEDGELGAAASARLRARRRDKGRRLAAGL